jgi:phosphate transport system protein
MDSTLEGTAARHQYNEDLKALEHMLLEMGSLAETMVGNAVDSMMHLDADLAIEVIRMDDEVDERDLEIETRCLRLLALQSPTGVDLRTIGTAMKMITDLERVGDLAVDIAKAGMKIEKELGSPSVVDVPKMSAICRSMLRQALEAFVKRDADLVAEVVAKDDSVDQMYRDLREQIHEHMRHSPEAVVSDSWLLLTIHHLERVADHAVNIAERVSFVLTGRLEQLAKSHKADAPSVDMG